MKPFDLDTLLNLKDLEFVQLAHHLRPIFGLFFNYPFKCEQCGYKEINEKKQITIRAGGSTAKVLKAIFVSLNKDFSDESLAS